ncbi:hypothetical protein POM88_034022 [Heracleum sosnowskyi]|uniref:Uncharacterized protein n=1 Tax=Heracleum sosnowskyi TaxID=360622 RepID=A0AAD8HKX0_9APIA|nr:hypothetical protein POM88_034022 [Heracleum sosnowskyi]
MATKNFTTKFSSSGKVAYAITNFVGLLEKESVHADFHPLMDFLKNSPISYALTASPPIYAEIVQEMWSTADCSSTRGGIKFTIKGKSYIVTPSVINEALHFPESNFENIPTHDRNDTLQVHMQSKKLFASLVTKNLNANVEFVLPEHVKVQLATLHSALSHTSSLLLPPTMEDVREGFTSPTQVALPTPYQSGTVATSSISESAGKGKRSKRKRATFPPVETRDDVPAAPEAHLPQKKKDASKVSSLPVVNHEVPPAETRDYQHLVNTASVLKSQLVADLTSNADKLSSKEMITVAKKCYNKLQGLGIDYIPFSSEVNKMIAKHQEVEFFAERTQKWKEDDIRALHNHQVQCLSEVTQKLSSSEDQLSTAKTNADSLKLKREELRGAILKLTEDLSEVEERVKTLTAERDQCEEADSVAEAELGKLDAEKEEAYREINDKYNAASEEYKRTSNQLLQLVRR